MEESHTSSAANKNPSSYSTPTNHHSPSAADQSSPSANLEHEDSPMRKRPRLAGRANESGQERKMSSDQTLPPDSSPDATIVISDRNEDASDRLTSGEAVPNGGPPLNPSKVTLNLRSAETISSSPSSPTQVPTQPEQISNYHSEDNGPENARMGYEHLDSPSSTLSATSIHLPLNSLDHSDQNPVVEIINESDEELTSYERGFATENEAFTQPRLLEEFPLSQEYGAEHAALAICEHVSKEPLQIDILERIAEWLQEIWLKNVASSDDVQPFYVNSQNFWAALANIFWKLMTRKSHLGELVCSGLGGPEITSRRLRDIFFPYVRLCAHLVAVDLPVIRKYASNPNVASQQQIELVSPRHLKNLAQMVKNFSLTPLFRVLWETYHVAMEEWQHKLFLAFINSDVGSVAALGELCVTLLSTPALVSAFHIEVDHCALISRSISLFLRDHRQKSGGNGSEHIYAQVSRPWLQLIHAVENFLQAISERHSGISLDLCFRLLEHAAGILEDIAMVDIALASTELIPDFGDLQDVSPRDLPRLITLCLYLRVCLKFIAKGRMELRVAGVTQLSTQLATFWRDLSDAGADSGSPAHKITARWIANQRLVEYLVSVDSHPQLISRSQDILGFVMVTHQWTQTMTDAVWETVSASPDPRVISATLDLLGRIMHLSNREVISAFCDKIDSLPAVSSIPGIPFFLDKLRVPLIDRLRSKDSNTTEDLQRPLLLFIRIICDTAEHQARYPGASGGTNLNMIQGLHTMALSSLQQLSIAADDSEGRKAVYKSCFEDIQDCSDRAIGSLESILALLCSHEAEDKSILITEMDLLRGLAENTCSFIDQQKKDEPNQPWLVALDPRLRLFARLLSIGETPSLPNDVEERLWDHLVGQAAFNDFSRDQAWKFLVEIVRNCRQADALVDKCINQFIWKVPPSLFTSGMFNFVQESMQYTQRVNPTTIPQENLPIQIPLADLLWKIILQAPDNSIERYASTLLSQHHLDTSLIKLAPMSSIAATHTALIERCLDQLKHASNKLSSCDDRLEQDAVSSTMMNMDVENRLDEEIRFRRTLQFLKRFTQDVRARPVFRDQDLAAESPITESIKATDIRDEQIEVKYQAFKPGMEHEIKTLRIGVSSTIAELADKLRQKTGIRMLRLILAGSPFSIDEHGHEKVETIQNKGLLIVLNDGTRKGSTSSSKNSTSNSVAERVLMNHFDTFYDFLMLDEKLSSSVFEFLLDFPPHDRVKDLILSADNVDLESLFPQGNRVKALYSLKCIKDHLLRMIHESPDDDDFILKGVRVLSSALTSSHWVITSLNKQFDAEVLSLLVDCLSIFLKQRPTRETISAYMVNESAIVDQLFMMLEHVINYDQDPPRFNCSIVYGCLIEAALQNREVWKALIGKTNVVAIHFWLLVENVDSQQRQAIENSIESIFACNRTPDTIPSDEFVAFFWTLLSDMIPSSAAHPFQCREVLATLKNLFLNHQSLSHDEQQLRDLLAAWCSAFSKYVHSDEHPQGRRDEFVYGISKLLSLGLSFVKQFKKPIEDKQLVRICFDRYLFPPVIENDMPDSDTRGFSSHLQPILCSESRRELYNLVLALCDDSKSYEWLVRRTSELTDDDDTDTFLSSPVDISRWLRSSTGYVGLTNLTNTCYMNSLLAQLFMNDSFRKFILSASVPDANGSQKLLSETQWLMANMQSSSRRFVSTEDFTMAIQPYDADRIDIAIQMDVDEFYNLLFDRWESQMLSTAAKQQFKSFYEGQLVTQIKSKDCEHVSETVEPFMAIQCEVRGKSNLSESLHAYVQGDTMEGDNKYKCESCGGKFVNAVKRSCVKDLPDNLIFHLKRFDFDLSTFDRHKINDEFAFPGNIDMRQYGVDFLNNPASSPEPDDFELVGVLVHNGTAESGHYYSYVRLPPHTPASGGAWAEFNDTEVTEFDPAKIPEHCFGGTTNHGDFVFPRQYNAYMLFYRRVAACHEEPAAATSKKQKDPEKFPTDPIIERKIASQNDALIRRYCRFDPTHAHFLRNIVSRCKDIDGGSCSTEHKREHEVLNLAIDHAKYILSVAKDVSDLDATINLWKKFVSSCSDCASFSLDCIFRNEPDALNIFLVSASAKARWIWTDLVMVLLKTVKKYDPQRYGIDADAQTLDPKISNIAQCGPESEEGVFFRVLHALEATIPLVGRYIRAWDEYFTLWGNIVDSGISELAVLLSHGIFLDFLQILAMPEMKQFMHGKLREVFEHVSRHMSRHNRPIPRIGLVRAIRHCFSHVNPFNLVEDYANAPGRLEQYDVDSRRFPLARQEAAWVFHPRLRQGQGEFLTRILDAWDVAPDAEPCIPAEIVWECMTSASLVPQNGNRITTSIALSLTTLVDEYHTLYAKAVLQSCLAFCQLCPKADDAKKMIAKAAESAESIKELKQEPQKTALDLMTECSPQGGRHFLEFFTRLSEMNDATCGSVENQSPFVLLVIQLVPTWAPALLMFDVKEVRVTTMSFLEHLIFVNYPFHLADMKDSENFDEDMAEIHVSSLDLARIRVIRYLFENCVQAVHRAIQYRLANTFLQPSVAILTQCATWCDKLTHEDASVLSVLQEKMSLLLLQENRTSSFDVLSESEWVVARWREFEPRLRECHYDTDRDEALSDTECWSSGDDVSDTFTDV